MRISLLPKNITLFNKTRELEQQIDEFFDKVSQAGMVFSRALGVYLAEGACDEFESFLNQVSDIEGKGDSLRRASCPSKGVARAILVPTVTAQIAN